MISAYTLMQDALDRVAQAAEQLQLLRCLRDPVQGVLHQRVRADHLREELGRSCGNTL